MSAAGIRAGKAFVEIGANDTALMKGLRAAQAKLKKFGMGLSAVGGGLSAASAAVLGPLTASVQVFAGSGDELSKMADRTGASVEALSELRHAAAQSDVEVTQLQTGLNRMSKVIGEAATGSDGAAETLAHLGLTAAQLQSMSVDQQFEAIADALAGIEDPALRTMRALDVFG